jgi:hypothetical protein
MSRIVIVILIYHRNKPTELRTVFLWVNTYRSRSKSLHLWAQLLLLLTSERERRVPQLMGQYKWPPYLSQNLTGLSVPALAHSESSWGHWPSWGSLCSFLQYFHASLRTVPWFRLSINLSPHILTLHSPVTASITKQPYQPDTHTLREFARQWDTLFWCHLLFVHVAYLERQLVSELSSQHHHAGHPEEQYVVASLH